MCTSFQMEDIDFVDHQYIGEKKLYLGSYMLGDMASVMQC